MSNEREQSLFKRVLQGVVIVSSNKMSRTTREGVKVRERSNPQSELEHTRLSAESFQEVQWGCEQT